MATKTDLNVDDAHKVPQVLHEAAFGYYESMSKLSWAWQKSASGKVWGKIAKELDRTADKIEKIVKKY